MNNCEYMVEERANLFCFENTGEIWTAISAGIMLFVAVLALIPILKESVHKLRVKNTLRPRLLFELNVIHESYFGKILAQLSWFCQKSSKNYHIPETDILYFDRLEKLFEETAYISKCEKKKIQRII